MKTEKQVLHAIGEKLKELRIKKGYTSYETFAIDNELSRMQYWRIEKGLSNITVRSLMRILDIHKITVEEFFKDLTHYSKNPAQNKP
jgi:transcriptional regulator with XRE-family HTH domain